MSVKSRALICTTSQLDEQSLHHWAFALCQRAWTKDWCLPSSTGWGSHLLILSRARVSKDCADISIRHHMSDVDVSIYKSAFAAISVDSVCNIIFSSSSNGPCVGYCIPAHVFVRKINEASAIWTAESATSFHYPARPLTAMPEFCQAVLSPTEVHAFSPAT